MFPFHCSQAISFFLFLASKTQCFSSKYTTLVSSVPIPSVSLLKHNVNLACLKEREGQSTSHRNRRHQENMKQILHIQCQTWNGDYAFLHVPIPSAHLLGPNCWNLIQFYSALEHTYIEIVIDLPSVLHLVQWLLNSPYAWIVIHIGHSSWWWWDHGTCTTDL